MYTLLVRVKPLDLSKSEMFSLASYLVSLALYMHVHAAYEFKKSCSEPALSVQLVRGAGPIKFP